MKVLLILSILFSLAVALELTQLEPRQGGGGERGGGREGGGRKGRPHKKTTRPKRSTGAAAPEGVAARRPPNAPDRYKTSFEKPGRKRSKTALQKLPADLIDSDAAVLRRRQTTANDFYECQGANPKPQEADCDVIIDQVDATNQTLILAANTCTTFGYDTCKGFFCSLCGTLSTTTDFVANQLSSVESLCVSQGLDGTLVGEDSPQWDAGFVYETENLPTYDVC